MNKTLSALWTALLLTAASPAFAASTDLTVTGIITPGACTPSLSGDYLPAHQRPLQPMPGATRNTFQHTGQLLSYLLH
jgi:type 1 fimbria pilin